MLQNNPILAAPSDKHKPGFRIPQLNDYKWVYERGQLATLYFEQSY